MNTCKKLAITLLFAGAIFGIGSTTAYAAETTSTPTSSTPTTSATAFIGSSQEITAKPTESQAPAPQPENPVNWGKVWGWAGVSVVTLIVLIIIVTLIIPAILRRGRNARDIAHDKYSQKKKLREEANERERIRRERREHNQSVWDTALAREESVRTELREISNDTRKTLEYPGLSDPSRNPELYQLRLQTENLRSPSPYDLDVENPNNYEYVISTMKFSDEFKKAKKIASARSMFSKSDSKRIDEAIRYFEQMRGSSSEAEIKLAADRLKKVINDLDLDHTEEGFKALLRQIESTSRLALTGKNK